MLGYKRGVSPDTRACKWSRKKAVLAEDEVQRAWSCVSEASILITKDVPRISSAWSRFAACFAFFRTFFSYLRMARWEKVKRRVRVRVKVNITVMTYLSFAFRLRTTRASSASALISPRT